MLELLKVPSFLRAEAKLVSTLILLGGLIGFWSALPGIGKLYNEHGNSQYQIGNLSTAEKSYKRAIALNPNSPEPHLNLGFLYAEWLLIDEAKSEYQFAASAGLPLAYSALARLHILEENYSDAVNLLQQGLYLTSQPIKYTVYPEHKYSLYKNLGWARLGQFQESDSEDLLINEAAEALEIAIEIASQSDALAYIGGKASAHCLLAQVFEELESSDEAIQQWEICQKLGNRLILEEELWLRLAQERLNIIDQTPSSNSLKP